MRLASRVEAQGILDSLRKLPDKVFGTGPRLAILENLLLAESQNEWVGLFGRGGIGKTLPAEQTFNSKKVRERFQQHFWVTVGQNPSIEQLQKNLSHKMNVFIENMKPDEAKTRPSNALERKTVLLLLDDVPDDGVDVLGMLGVPSKHTGSKILVTTRHIKVLKKRKASDECIVRVESLTAEDSRKMFCEHAFGGVDNIPHQLDQTVIKAVVEECKGLPLALKVIATALAGETALASETFTGKWKSQLKNLQEARPLDEDQEHQLYGILRLSYDLLRPSLQKCFIYFAAFPEDYDVDSQKLANLWAGEKMLEGAQDAYIDFDPLEETFYLLAELIQRSLIDLQRNYDNPWRITCRIHDVLRDFARYLIERKEAPIAMDCLFRAGQHLTEFPNKWLKGPAGDVTHLSLIDNSLKSLLNELKAPKLEVLLLSSTVETSFHPKLVISPEILESFWSLKVLDLEKCPIDSLPETVGSVLNLIYLDLSKTRLRLRPVGLQKLTKLENLSLRGCADVGPWPFDISRLRCLFHSSYGWQ